MTNARRKLLIHNGRSVIYLDHRNLEGAAYLEAVRQSLAETKARNTQRRLILVDSTGAVMDKTVLKATKQLTAQVSHNVDRVALVGITGVQRMFVRAVATFSKTNMKPFDNQEDALAWLTEDVPPA